MFHKVQTAGEFAPWYSLKYEYEGRCPVFLPAKGNTSQASWNYTVVDKNQWGQHCVFFNI